MICRTYILIHKIMHVILVLILGKKALHYSLIYLFLLLFFLTWIKGFHWSLLLSKLCRILCCLVFPLYLKIKTHKTWIISKNTKIDEITLKALFNNVFTLKNLSCMTLHAIRLSLVRCKNEALKKLHLKSIIKCFKRVKIDKWPDSPYSFSPIDYCVRINGEPDRLFSGDIQS